MKLASVSWPGLTRTTLELCRLRSGPADLPHAPPLLAALIIAAVVLDVLTGSAFEEGGLAFARSLLSTGVVLVLCAAALAIRQRSHRFVQTATALLACSLLFSLLQLPLALLAGPAPVGPAHLSSLQILIGWITIGLFLWQLSVDAHIVRQAMDASFGFAFALVFAWVLAYWALDRVLFGAVT